MANKMKQKKDFWDMSFNPVWGCLNKCPFCYARRIARHYAEQIAEKEISFLHGEEWNSNIDLIKKYNNIYEKLKSFTPTWLESNYVRKFPRKPSIIFVNSMSDPAYWEQEWYERIVKKIAENMQHTFVVLTKQPEIYERYIFPLNTVIGCTITSYKERIKERILYFFRDCSNTTLLSIEPIQDTFSRRYIELLGEIFDWIHVGQESGNRAGRIRATREMIEPFFNLDIPVFMKNNLEGICGDRPLRKEFPV